MQSWPTGLMERLTGKSQINYLQVCLVGVILVLIVIECAALVFISTMAVDNDVSTKGVFIF